MAWEPSFRYPYLMRRDHRLLPHSFGVNEQCFIRKEHECGKMYGASKSCFIACPTDDNLEPILELMSEKLSKVGVEPIVAVKERAYGQDIFCTKICGKIIESRFCIVILDDSEAEALNIPNPNVYYEYGLMTSIRKHIIPLQREDLDLAFNIQSYDTIKYTQKNIGSELDRAIRDALRLTEAQDSEAKRSSASDRTILRRLELAGFQAKSDSWFLWRAIEDTQLKGFGHADKNVYLYLGKIDESSDFQDYLEDLDVTIYRTEKKAEDLANQIRLLDSRKKEMAESAQSPVQMSLTDAIVDGRRVRVSPSLVSEQLRRSDMEIKEKQNYLDSMSTVYVGFVIDSHLDPADFKKNVQVILEGNSRYKAAYSSENELWIDDICVNLGIQGK